MTAGARARAVAVDAVADRPERTYTYLAPGDEPVPRPARCSSCPTGGGSPLAACFDGSPEPAGADLRLIEAVVSPMLTPDLLALRGDRGLPSRTDRHDARGDAAAGPGIANRATVDLLQPDDLPPACPTSRTPTVAFPMPPFSGEGRAAKERLGRAAPPRGDPSPAVAPRG